MAVAEASSDTHRISVTIETPIGPKSLRDDTRPTSTTPASSSTSAPYR
jgi:hypothetical protein